MVVVILSNLFLSSARGPYVAICDDEEGAFVRITVAACVGQRHFETSLWLVRVTCYFME